MKSGAGAFGESPYAAADHAASGIVLAGGGSYGAYEVGVMRALFAGHGSACAGKPLDPHLFAGTSIGALNAAVIVAHAEAGLSEAVGILEEIWLKEIAETSGRGNGVYRLRGLPPFVDSACLSKPLEGFGQAMRDGVHLIRESIAGGRRFLQARDASPTRRLLEMVNLRAFFDTTPLRELLSAILPLDSIARSTRRLQVIATNFDTGQVRIFENEEIASASGYDALMASAAIPLFFPPVSIAGDLYIDGGTLQNSPILPAVHRASTLHVVYMDPDVENMPLDVLDSTVGILDRLLVTSWAYNISQEIAVVSDFNESFDFLDRRGSLPPIDDPMMERLLSAGDAVASAIGHQERWTRTTIHQYHPTDDLGDITGFLDLSPERIQRLIDRGYDDTIRHDCERNGCVLPR